MSKDWKEMERVVAKKLGAWWGVTFRRTPSSGAWSKNSQRGSVADEFHGDIVAPYGSNFPFSVECKSYESLELYKSLYGIPELFGWWEQCKEDADRSGKIPLLVMRENRKQRYLIAISIGVYKVLPRLDLTHSENGDTTVPRMALRYSYKGRNRQLVLFDLDLFLLRCRPQYVLSKLGVDDQPR